MTKQQAGEDQFRTQTTQETEIEMANGGGDSFLAGVILGGIAGFAVGVMLAPKSGAEMRADLLDRTDSAREQLWDRTGAARDQIWDRTGSAREQIWDRTGTAREQTEDLIDAASQRLEEIRAEAAQLMATLRQRVNRNSSDDDDMPVMAEFETAPQDDEEQRS